MICHSCGKTLTREEAETAELILESDAECFDCIDKRSPSEFDRVTWVDWAIGAIMVLAVAAYVAWRVW